MPNPERPPLTAERSGGFYLAIGAVVVAALIGAYVLIGTPGLHQPVAKAPDQPATVAQETAPAPNPR